MAEKLPTHSQVVIIGGGIVGASIAYHLTKLGMTDVLLLERKTLTSGTTWHAAGLVGQLRATQNMTKLAQYTSNLMAGLAEETGQETGFVQNGSVSVASNKERFEELKRGASMAKVFGLEVDVITPKQIADYWPLVNTDDLVGGVWLPGDGRTNPSDTTMAFIKGAKMYGATVHEHIKVTGITQKDGRVTGVDTDQGHVTCEIAINCAGMWGREVGKMAGARVPLHAAEHFYIITEPIEGLKKDLPTLRDPGGYTYYREEVGAILAGFFEPNAKPWGMKGIPDHLEYIRLGEDWDHLGDAFDKMAHRMPVTESAGIHTFFNGPESFTPDDRYHLGESPELKNFYVAAGFNSIGIQSSGGAGKVLAEWIVNGHPPMDLWDVDVRRNAPFMNNHNFLRERTREGLGLLYAMHWPFYQFETSRNVRKSALHDRLAAASACFGTAAGWERPNWFAPEGVEPKYEYSYGRQNWFEHSAAEHQAVREAVGVFDQSSFSKFIIQGRDAVSFLNRICGAQIDVPINKVAYTQLLNVRGGIEGDVTVTRLAKDEFYLLDAAATQNRTVNWLKSQIQEDEFVTVTDVTSGWVMLGVMGPNSRQLLEKLTDADLSNEAFPFGTSQEIDLGMAIVRATRMTYVGELGWEINAPTEFAQHVYDEIMAAGADLGVKNCGYHAMSSLRMEKGYRHWGDDITDEETPVQAGLRFAVDFTKESFNGKDVLVAQKANGVSKRLVQFKLEDENYLLYHNEPVWRNGEMVGYITSGMFAHTFNAAIGMGYVSHPDGEPVTAAYIREGEFEIEIAGEIVKAKAQLRPFYDPKSKRTKM
ncbi:MAG: glycine cleavage system T protein [Candidatus Promineifilaceae bacterium]|jgi:glycine cleavage system T protein